MNVENEARQLGYSKPLNEKEAYTIAKSFAALTSLLSGGQSDPNTFQIPNNQNLRACYDQFEEAISHAGIMRLLRATHLISELRQRKKLLVVYEQLNNKIDYPNRLIYYSGVADNNLAKNTSNNTPLSTEFATPKPGKFFQDLGDMIRTMVCSIDENSTQWEAITIRNEYYFATTCGYLDGVGQMLTKKEKEALHYSGLLVTYLQTLRFVTDFLMNDIYYQTSYSEQNLNRALNQYILLEQLEEFLERKYHFTVPV